MESSAGCNRSSRRGWLDDLAELSADALVRGRALAPLLLVVVLALLVTGIEAPALALSVALAIGAVWGRRRRGFSVPDPTGSPPRRATAIALVVVLFVLGRTHEAGWQDLAELVTLALLADVARRGRWLPWTLLVAVAMTISGFDGDTDVLPHLDLAAPLLVVLASRAARFARSTDGGDAAAARLAQRIVHHPWRAAFVASLLAHVVSLDVYASIPPMSDLEPNADAYGFVFFAFLGIASLCTIVLFHALLRSESAMDVLAAALAPVAIQAVVWLGIGFAARMGSNSGPSLLEILTFALGLPALLPVLGGAIAGRGPRRSRGWIAPLAWSIFAAGAVLWPLTAGSPWPTITDNMTNNRTAAVHLFASFAIPGLLLVHALAVSPISGRWMLWLGLAGSIVVAVLAAEFVDPELRGPHGAELFKGLAAMSAFTVVLATATAVLSRRLREITPLPADHPVLFWEEALRADEARQ